MIELVLLTGVVVAILTIVMLCGILLMRLWLLVKERRRKRFYKVWRPLLVQCVEDVPQAVPRVSRLDRLHFLYYWNYFHESLRGEAKQRLNQVARLAGMDRTAAGMLKRGGVRKRLLAIATLGHLRERSVWNELQDLAASDHPVLSLAAARALIQIDAKAAMPVLSPLIGAREDWSPTKVAAILREAGPDLIVRPLAIAAFSAPPGMAVRLISYLEATQSKDVLPLVRSLMLRWSADDRVQAAALSLIGRCQDPQDLEIVRSYVSHSNWQVRAQAVIALGKMGVRSDETRLIAMLADPQWEVRYRAAEALAGLPFVTRDRLAQIQSEQTDDHAKEILTPFLFPLQRS